MQFSCVFSQWCFLQKGIFSNVVSVRCSPGVTIQTEGKIPTEVLWFVSSKLTNLIKATGSESLHPCLA